MAVFILGEVGAGMGEGGAAFVKTVGVVDAGAGSLVRSLVETMRLRVRNIILFRYPS